MKIVKREKVVLQ